jgi:putative Mg2+ transporter-C (MgtC) family protein
VHGLTSASALWVTAALGVVAGLGELLLALVSTVVALTVLALAPVAERHLRRAPASDESPTDR